MAVVTLGLCIEGNSLSTRIPKQLRTRKDLQNALSQIASDVQTEDCLLSAEILWIELKPGNNSIIIPLHALVDKNNKSLNIISR